MLSKENITLLEKMDFWREGRQQYFITPNLSDLFNRMPIGLVVKKLGETSYEGLVPRRTYTSECLENLLAQIWIEEENYKILNKNVI